MLQPVEQRTQTVAGQVPDTLPVEERLVEQGADWTEIHHVAGQGVIDRSARKDIDLGAVGPPDDLQFARLGDLAGEPDAAGAHDAPVLVQLDLVGDVFARVDDPLLDVTVVSLPVIEAEILQAAFSGLVADGAVERMVDQEVLHDHPLVFLDPGAVGHDDRHIPGRGLAGGGEPGEHLNLAGLGVLAADLDLAHPAVGHHRQRGVPAEVRDLDPGPGGGLDHVEIRAVSQRPFFAVDDDRSHGSLGSIGRDG
jgi:hypothetical protein